MDVAHNAPKANYGHTHQCVNEWPLMAVSRTLSEGYKPFHLPVVWLRWIPSSSQLHPLTFTHSLSFIPPSLRQERSTRPNPSQRRQTLFTPPPHLELPTLLPTPPPTTLPHLITPDHNVDPQEQRPGVFFAQ